MRKIIISLTLFFLINILSATEGVRIIRVLLEKRPYEMIDISITVKNIADKPIDELSGIVDIYNPQEKVLEKIAITLLYDADMPLKPECIVRRKKVIDYRPEMAGTARLRITHLRFYGDDTIYTVCPHCNALVIKE